MEHAEVRELLEDAAIEPGGLERLMAGDTPSASLVAGHLAGCPDCAEELERLRRSVELIAPAIRSVPPPELRERTLAYVAAVGRPRGAAAVAPPVAEPDQAPWPRPVPVPVAVAGNPAGPVPGSIAARRSLRLAPLLGLAAALVLAVSGGAFVANASRDAEVRLQAAEIDALGDVARGTIRLDAQPDVQRVALAASAAGPTGELIFSPSSTEVVVVADGLAPAASGHEYRCWVEQDGKRMPIGKMFFGGSVAYWVGPVPALATLSGSATFGVSLIEVGGTDGRGEQVLVGQS